MPRTAQLLVEGKDDFHIVSAICEQHQIEQCFSIIVPGDGGVEEVLKGIPVRLKGSGLWALGIVIDADESLQDRWFAVCHRLEEAGYSGLPLLPSAEGAIIALPDKPRIGVWLMPDNQLPGMLENFAAHLIPDSDPLIPKVENSLKEIECEGLCRYSPAHHPKAFIHTWLAWQERPGQPMGQAITAHVLQHDRPLALSFVNWLHRLFM